jgi:succinyl-CoA synthetase alpha subunit/citrate synthase
MKATSLRGILKKGDRVAVSNITGREASKVTAISQMYCGNVVGGWALGKEGQVIELPDGNTIKVHGQFDKMMKSLSKKDKPNKIIVYSPPDAVYGDVKEIVEHGKGFVETVFVITEHVSIEVTAKLRRLCDLAGVDILGCNTLGVINPPDKVRIGAVGGDTPHESFRPGSATIISNSGNMVNTIASYLQSAGIGVSFGLSTGKDALILTPLKDLLELAQKDRRTKMIILYVEPGGIYEKEAIAFLRTRKSPKPLVVYVSGAMLEDSNVSLGHAGAVVEGADTSASAKMQLFDDYLGTPVFDRQNMSRMRTALTKNRKGLRVQTLHAIAPAASAIASALKIPRDFRPKKPLSLNPWVVNLDAISKQLTRDLILYPGSIPDPYGSIIRKVNKSAIGRVPNKQPMRNASHASSNDGATPRIYGRSLLNMMKVSSFAESVLLYWLGTPPAHEFEIEAFDMCLQAALTNGPGTISAQAAKLSASAGNEPNTAMISTLSAIGRVHGGNGQRAAKMLIKVFSSTDMADPYSKKGAPDLDKLVKTFVKGFKRKKAEAKELGVEYDKIPCLGHPVFNTDLVNFDPRERVLSEWLEEKKVYNVFLDFYHKLANEMVAQKATTKAHAVNVDAALTCVLMGIAWPLLVEKKISAQRATDLPFIAFALGRVAGGAGEYLDHRDHGDGMDMRIPVSECISYGKNRD